MGDMGADHAPNDHDGPDLARTRLEARAISERWPMSAAVRIRVLKRLAKIVDEEAWEEEDWEPSTREVIAASRALIAADKLNLDGRRLELEERRAELGREDLSVRDALVEAELADAEYDRQRSTPEGGPAPGPDRQVP